MGTGEGCLQRTGAGISTEGHAPAYHCLHGRMRKEYSNQAAAMTNTISRLFGGPLFLTVVGICLSAAGTEADDSGKMLSKEAVVLLGKIPKPMFLYRPKGGVPP